MMKKLNLIIAASMLAASMATSFAQDSGTAHQFIRIPRDPVSGAMGGAGAASTFTTAYSSFRNAAVIPFSDKDIDIGVSYQMWAPDGVKSNNVSTGIAYKLSDSFGLSLGFGYDAGGEIRIYDASGKPAGTFSSSDMVFNAGFGYRFSEKMGAGASFRYSSDNVAEGTSLSAFGADVFILYQAMPGLGLAAGVSSIGSSVKGAAGETYSLPVSATAAGSYRAEINGRNTVDIAIDADYFLSGSFAAAFGLQYSYNDMISVRAGYHLGTDGSPLPSFATVGAGVQFAGFKFDLSYLTANDIIGNTIAIGVGASF